ncbi:MAG: efflux transporter periplasmic adaptor subunit, partial [Tannerella sp.]|nr:efflux transporter periplasmic adaptor subunit [Tannerella sp.]
MKKNIIYLFIATAMIACGCSNEHKERDHATENDHEHFEGDGHDHSAHNDADGAHDDEIHFSASQAEAAGLETEDIAPGVFSHVIKTSGQIQATQGDEITLTATSSGIVSFINQS